MTGRVGRKRGETEGGGGAEEREGGGGGGWGCDLQKDSQQLRVQARPL